MTLRREEVLGEVRLKKVSFRYEAPDPARPSEGANWTLRHIDLDVPAGTRTAIVGETGSGKTTLAKLLTRLMDPTSGMVRKTACSTLTTNSRGV